jgi:hypothetical protein
MIFSRIITKDRKLLDWRGLQAFEGKRKEEKNYRKKTYKLGMVGFLPPYFLL